MLILDTHFRLNALLSLDLRGLAKLLRTRTRITIRNGNSTLS